MNPARDRILSKFVNDNGTMGLGSRIKAKRIFFSNIILAVSCFAFLPFALDEIWLVLMIACWLILGFVFSLVLLKLSRLNAAAVLHLCATAYGIVCLQLFISDSYADTLTFLCLSFIFIVDGLLVSTRMYQLYIIGAAALTAQIAAPLLNINQKLNIGIALQLESLVLFAVFFTVVLLVKLDNRELLLIAKSENKKAKKRLERYRGVFQNSTDALMMIGNNEMYTDCNRAALRLFQLQSKDDLMTSGLHDLSPEYQPDGSPSAEKASIMIETAIKKGAHSFEWRHARPNGDIIDTNVLLTAINSGQDKRLLCTVSDISGQKRARSSDLQSQRKIVMGGIAAGIGKGEDSPVKEALKTVTALSDRLTRKTLPANLKAAELAGTTMYSIDAFMKRRGIPHMLNSLTGVNNRLSRMTDTMLEAARNPDSRFSQIAPELLVEEVLAMASHRYESDYDFKVIAVKKEYEPDLPKIACDKPRIERVLMALLANGAHRMFSRPPRTPDATPQFIVRISTVKPRNMLKLEIEDNGPPLDTDARKRIFEPFFIAEPPGTGLDLPIAYFIVTEMHKGSLAVESVEHLGTNFIIQLPISAQRIRHEK